MRKFYKILLAVSLCIFGSFLLPQPAAAQVQTARTIATGPNSNGFYEYLPAGYSSGSAKYPLIVFLHGSGELGNGGSDLPKVLDNGPPMLIANGQFPTSFTVNGKTSSFIVISPQFVAWPADADVDAVIEYAKAHYRVDTGRVYLTGLSMGGSAVWSYAPSTAHAYKLAAIVPIAGGLMYTETYGASVLASAGVAVFAAANLNDPTVSSALTVEDINIINSVTPKINPPALDTIYNASGHGGWQQTYDPNNAMVNGLNIYEWMLQYSHDDVISVPLPVTLTAFNASQLPGQQEVQLSWTTSFEQNNKYFLIQRASDAQQYATIDTVAAAADAEGGHSYTDVDAHPAAGPNYYRLVQVDLDGKTNYSPVREVTIGQNGEPMQLSPNPADATLYVELDATVNGPLDIRLLDVQGKTLRTLSIVKPVGSWSQSMDVGGLAPGSYFVQVLGTNFRSIKTFIKK